MPNLGLDEVAEQIGIKRSALDRIINNGKELVKFREGRRFVVKSEDIDTWRQRKEARRVVLTKEDFVKAFKFALKINYAGHTRADFGSARQRSTTQAVENWTQGGLAEIALSKFIFDKFHVKLELEFRVFQNTIVGQDIVAVTKNRVTNPPRSRTSVKSGKQNGMFLIVPINEAERADRQSDYYVFVRIIYSDDFILRLFRDAETLADMVDTIPEFEDFEGEIVGYCLRSELERRDSVPEASIPKPRYVKPSGLLKNSDAHWQAFVDAL
ncbi:hypothetical protein HYX06_03200 [Candidatus Woesearchaeota archaeon]|nr:hypothetical protein [Candidatus Woesearchaeota archaeon]